MNEFADIIAQLEQRRASIDKALEALRGIEGAPAVAARKRGRPPGTTSAPTVAAKKSGGLSEEGRKSLAENMRKRWAIKRAAARKAVKKATKKSA